MYFPLFTVPRLREAVGNVYPDKAVGRPVLSGPDDGDSLQMLFEHWNGLLRALVLAGYRPVQAFVEYRPPSPTNRLVLDLGKLGYGVSTLFPPDDLDAARDTAPAMLIGLAVDPLWLFGEPGGAPLALLPEMGPTPSSGSIAVDRLAAIDGVFPALSATDRGWLGFTYDGQGIRKMIGEINDHALAVATVLADAVSAAWAFDPAPLGPPCGLGWAFDERNWLFPARADNWPDPDARRLKEALRVVCDELRPADAYAPDFVIEPFIASQVVRRAEPFTFAESGSFGHELRTRSGPDVVEAASDAYRERVEGLWPAETRLVEEVSGKLGDHYTFTDAVLTMVEHGALGIAHRLLPGLPSTAIGNQPNVSIPEWTTPQLTGRWDAVVGTDTLILNQAGTRIAGFWQRRVANRLDRYIVDGRQSGGTRTGGPLSFSASCWHQTALLPWANLEAELGPPLNVGQITVSQVAGEVPQLTLSVDIKDGKGATAHEFQFSELEAAAHATEASMVGLSDASKQRIRTLRDAPLHRAEIYVPEFLAKTAATYVERWLDEQPNWVDLTKLLDEFKSDVEHEVGAFTAKKDLMHSAQEWVRRALTHRRASEANQASCRDLLGLMFRMTFRVASSVWLQQVYGMVVQVQSGQFLYQWRLTGVTMTGGAWVVAGAKGSGTFELRRVDTHGTQIGSTVSRPIDLTTGGFLVEIDAEEVVPQAYSGLRAFEDWSAFAPTNRDITQHLDGAPVTFSTGGASFLAWEFPGAVDIELAPTDGLQPLIGQSVPPELNFTLDDPLPDDATMNDVYDRFKAIKGFFESLKGIADNIKKGKLPTPTIETSVTEGWIRDPNGPAAVPAPAPVPVERYQDTRAPWTRFATNQYDLTPQFRTGCGTPALEYAEPDEARAARRSTGTRASAGPWTGT